MEADAGPSNRTSKEIEAQPQVAPGGVESTNTGSGGSSSSSSRQAKRGIPLASFVADVAEFVGDRDPDSVLRGLEERLQQYRMLDLKLLTQQRDLQSKVPEIQKSLDVVKRLKQHQGAPGTHQEPLVSDFEVADGIFCKAKIASFQSVCLWLGANVMLEYSVQEALDLLSSNLSNANASLNAMQKDLDLLRDQINTTEVTMARVHNWEIKRRRERQKR